MIVRTRLCFALFAAFTLPATAPLYAQAGTPEKQPPETPAPSPASQSQLPDAPGVSQGAPSPVATGPTIVLDTTMGRMTCKLFDKEAPIASANFIGLATGTKDWTDPVTQKKMHGVRFYDGTTFHRVIPGFMIQGGDHMGTGMGDAGYYFDNEQVPNLNFDVPGRLAMANAGPNTNGTQFFITEVAYPDLDQKYTIFGQCDEHSVVVSSSIARVDRNSQDKPYTPVVLTKVTVVREGQPMPPEPAAPPAAATPVATPGLVTPLTPPR